MKIPSIISKLFCLIFITSGCAQEINCNVSPQMRLWYNKPAANWNEALPVENGRLGAMIFGNPSQERIQLNEESMWTGQPQDSDNPEALIYLPVVREYLLDGNYVEAQRLMSEKMSCKKTAFTGEDGFDTDYGSYQTLGDLTLIYNKDDAVRDYYRALDLKDACVYISYSCGNTYYRREVFSSSVH